MEFLDAPPLPFYFSPEHGQFRASLRHHLDDSADRPAWYRKTRWLVERFNAAIHGTRYADLGVALDGNG